jgi:hypothetical protein
VNQLTALETMGISMVLGILQLVIKDEAKSASLQQTLMGLANDIYAAYGIAVAAVTVTGTAAASQLSALEQIAMTMVLGILQIVIKDPTKAASLKQQLIGLANDIYTAYDAPIPPSAMTTALGLAKAPAGVAAAIPSKRVPL